MEGLVFLSGEEPDLAFAEVNGALKALGNDIRAENVDQQIAVLPSEPPMELARRLGFSHFTGYLDEIKSLDLDEIIDGISSSLSRIDNRETISFQVKVPKGKVKFTSSELFDSAVKVAKDNGFLVRHRDPDKIIFIIIRRSTYIGRIFEFSERLNADKKRGSKMPYNRPIVMDPRLARVLINLSGLPPKSRILDPFVGPAGLAIEAAQLDIDVLGVEKEPEIYHGARVNVEHLGLSDRIVIKNGDSRKLSKYPWFKDFGRIDGIITDPPFGRSASTGGEEPGKLIEQVLSEIAPDLSTGSPLVIDSHSKDMIDNIDGFELKDIFSIRIHKSMTRYIAVLYKL